MTNMKKIVLMLLLFMATTAAKADNYSYLGVEATDGTTTQLPLTSLVLTFSDGQLVATGADGTTTFTLTDLACMFFSDGTTTGITQATTDGEGVVRVYNTNGVKVLEANSSQLSTLKAQLPKGIYLIQKNGVTQKMLVK